MKRLFFCGMVCFVVAGCSSVKQPVASRPLVEKSVNDKVDLVEQELWASLKNGQPGTEIFVSRQTAVMGQLFFSAAGKNCRQITFPKDLTRIVCQDKDSSQWHFIKPVISEYVENNFESN